MVILCLITGSVHTTFVPAAFSMVPTLVVFIHPLASGESSLIHAIIVSGSCFFFHQLWDIWLQMAIACSIGLPKDTVSQHSVSTQPCLKFVHSESWECFINLPCQQRFCFSSAHRSEWLSCWCWTFTHVLPGGSVRQPVEVQYGCSEFILRNHSSWSWKVINGKLGTQHVLIYELFMSSWCLIKCWYHYGYLIKMLIS